MREIKFRAWDKEEKKTIVIESLKTDDIGNLYYINRELVNPTNIVMMQYTGLKDKNGVEIYEGDIVRFSNNQIHDQTTVVCQWLDFRTGFVYKFLTGQYKGQFTDMTDTWREYEVIGNIFENPELREEE